VVVGRGVGGGELGLEAPRPGAAHEHVGRARLAARVVVAGCPDQRRVAGQRDRGAEVIAGRAVGGGELGLLVQLVLLRTNT